jgi:hypothetical protein
MHGTLHIFRIGEERDKYGRRSGNYQANYTTPGNTYSSTYNEEKLTEFLRTKIALRPSQLQQVMAELRTRGRVTMGEVDISAEEVGGLGLQQNPSDF